MTEEQGQLMTTEQVGELLGLKPATLVDWRHDGKGPRWYKMGRLTRYKLSDVLKWQDQVLVAMEPTSL